MAWTAAGPGRPLGTPRSGTVQRLEEARYFAKLIVENPTYREQLLQRAISGALHPHVETMLFYYAFGKPGENVEVKVNDERQSPEIIDMTDEALLKRLQGLAVVMSENLKAQKQLEIAGQVQREQEPFLKAKKTA